MFHNLFNEKPELGPLIIPGSTLGQFGESHCRALPGQDPRARYCWHEGPKTRFTLAAAEDVDPCPNDPEPPTEQDGDVDVPPCSYPKEFYVFGLAVTTSRGLKLAQALLGHEVK